ncbi:hypothetical protein P9112_006607 [Eukaryota sp. TZLM1-RC]
MSLLLVQKLGPLAFVLQNDATGAKFKTSIGSYNHCTCSSTTKPCPHVSFLLERYFKIPTTSPLFSQSGFNNLEVEQLLASSNFSAPLITSDNTINSTQPSSAPRTLTNDDDCAICMNQLLSSSSITLCYCAHCLNSFHPSCLSHWTAHSLSTSHTVRCPLCREILVSEQYKLTASNNKPLPFRSLYNHKKLCTRCSFSITGPLFKCRICSETHLCSHCFLSNVHSHHSFFCFFGFEIPWFEAGSVRSKETIFPKVLEEESDAWKIFREQQCTKCADKVDRILPCNHGLCGSCFDLSIGQNQCVACQTELLPPRKIQSTHKHRKSKISEPINNLATEESLSVGHGLIHSPVKERNEEGKPFMTLNTRIKTKSRAGLPKRQVRNQSDMIDLSISGLRL